MGVNTHYSRGGLQSRPVTKPLVDDPGRLALLIRERREGVRPRLSQTDFGRMIGLDQRSVSNIEVGIVRSLAPDIANKIPGIIPVTMAELVRALGYDLPVRHSPLAPDIQEGLETAPEPVLAAVRLLLAGLRATQAQGRR